MRFQASDDQANQQAASTWGTNGKLPRSSLCAFAIRSSIHVGEGKCVSALSGAFNKLKRRKLKIVTMYIDNAYYSWTSQEFPNVKIVFDHFHVIKLMNDKLDKVRR